MKVRTLTEIALFSSTLALSGCLSGFSGGPCGFEENFVAKTKVYALDDSKKVVLRHKEGNGEPNPMKEITAYDVLGRKVSFYYPTDDSGEQFHHAVIDGKFIPMPKNDKKMGPLNEFYRHARDLCL
ncbi:hypothetical protein CMI41_03340 [Candidatus Pacearchaeota archaeon]|jgi:hypothetical protein|nr:hypothetical protein [Candidatus Pacearchaeota archaeon]|tara:strand:+ start:4073 stop:4450 length:378 start_codon:yes stop_codon:yes gene_type:complete